MGWHRITPFWIGDIGMKQLAQLVPKSFNNVWRRGMPMPYCCPWTASQSSICDYKNYGVPVPWLCRTQCLQTGTAEPLQRHRWDHDTVIFFGHWRTTTKWHVHGTHWYRAVENGPCASVGERLYRSDGPSRYFELSLSSVVVWWLLTSECYQRWVCLLPVFPFNFWCFCWLLVCL